MYQIKNVAAAVLVSANPVAAVAVTIAPAVNKMKITKRQLRRIIKEERAKLVRETRDQADQNLKAYQDGYHGGAHVGVEEKLEDAVHSAVVMFMELNGVSEAEAEQMVMDSVRDIITRTR